MAWEHWQMFIAYTPAFLAYRLSENEVGGNCIRKYLLVQPSLSLLGNDQTCERPENSPKYTKVENVSI